MSLPLIIHLLTFAALIPLILYSDHEAFLYLRDKKPVLEHRKMTYLHYAVGTGLLIMIASGLYMAWPIFDIMLSVPSFAAKMAFVTLLVVNAFLLGSLIPIASTTPFAQLSTGQKFRLLASGAASAIGWIGATAAAFLTFGWIF
jgi:membrane-associated HD superfamily phosphohydrolase